MFGRKRIFCDADTIHAGNIESIISEAMLTHRQNAIEIKYLRRYLSGFQPVLERKKSTRKDILNKVVVNTAAEVMDFKLSYIFGAPLDIVRSANSQSTVDITAFQRMMDEQGKDGVDQEIAQDMLTGAFGYRGVLPNPNPDEASPFCLVDMSSETTFCVYKNDVFKRKLLGVSYIEREDKSLLLTAYTDSARFELESPGNGGPWKLVDTTSNGIGYIPIVEYAMPELMGVFEKAMPLMDALNTAASNRVDDLEQFIQSILWICGVDLDEEAQTQLKESLCLITPNVQEGAQPQVKFLVNNLDQNGIQGMVDDLYYHILEVCSCPGREQSSGGNTGAATELGAGGWRKAQYSAERIISAWQKGDREMYRIALAILEKSRKTPAELRGLKATDLETKFTLSKNNDLLTKTQGILNLMQAGVHPRIAYREVGVFSDPEQVYEESKETADKAMEKMHGSEDKSLGAVDVSNQPRSEGSLERNVTGKGSVQKRD